MELYGVSSIFGTLNSEFEVILPLTILYFTTMKQPKILLKDSLTSETVG
jgi:hypothetical protein